MQRLLAYDRALMLVVTLATLLLGATATRLQTEHTAGAFLDETSETMRDFERVGSLFGQSRTLLYVVFPTARADDPAFMQRLQVLTLHTDTLAGVDRALSLATLPVPVRDGSRLTTQPFFTPALDAEALRVRLDANTFARTLLVDSTGGAPLLLVKVNEKFNDTPARIGLVEAIRRDARALAPDAVLAGFPNTRSAYAQRISSEMPLFTVLALGLSLALLLLTFRAWRAALLPLVVVALGLVWTAGLMVLFGQQINIVTAVLPALLVIIGMATVVHFMARFYLAFDRTHDVEASVREMLETVGFAALLTSATTLVGFAVMALTGSQMLAGFGVFAALGVGLLYALTLIVLPFALRRLPPPRANTGRPATGAGAAALFGMLSTGVERHTLAVLAGGMLLLIGAGAGMSRLSTDLYVFADFNADDPLRQEIAVFEKHYGGLIPTEVLIESKTPGQMRSLATLERLDRLERELARLPGVGSARSAVGLVKAANQAYGGGDARAYRLPSRYELPFLQAALTDTRTGTMGAGLPRMVDTTFTAARILTGVADVGTSRMQALVDTMQARAQALFPAERFAVTVTGTGVLTSTGGMALLRNLLVSLAVALALISLLMAALFKSARLTWISLLPNLLPLVCVGGAMGWLGISLRPSTALIFPLAFGIAVDDTIHFLAKYRMLRADRLGVRDAVRETLRVTGRAIVLTSVVLMAGFLLFTFSSFGGTVSLGALTASALAAALLANLFVLPALLLRFDR